MNSSDSTAITCPNCGIQFAIRNEVRDVKRDNGKTLYCPNGHAMHFAESNVSIIDKLKAQIADLKKERDDAREELRLVEGELLKFRQEHAQRQQEKSFLQKLGEKIGIKNENDKV